MIWMFSALVQHPEQFVPRTINELWRALYLVPVVYFFYEYTIDYISRKRIIRSFFLLIFQLFLFSTGMYIWRSLGIALHIHTVYKIYESREHAVSDLFGNSVFAIVFFGIIRHAYNYQKLKQAAQQLRIEKQQAELNYLKSQTNPHFLFNTLNNIYSLSRDKSDLAPESILRLSKILRFMLYETSGKYISLEQELKIIGDYIALEKLRYDETLKVSFNYSVDNIQQPIPPLLLIPLVENAFKHGVSETRNQPFIDIFLIVEDKILQFFVKNSAEVSTPEGNVKENIGLSNLRRQLELLYSEYHLTVEQSDSVFTAKLKINLNSHV